MVTLTANMARGAARLAKAGAVLEAAVQVKGRTRQCVICGCDEDGANVTLRTMIGGDAVHADLPVGRVTVSERTGVRCQEAYDALRRAAGETEGLRVGRMANETPAQMNARLWLDYLARSGQGQMAGGC